MTNFSDRLADSILSRRSVVCVGIDPDLARLPDDLRASYAARVGELGDAGAVAACFAEFASGLIDAVADVAAAIKPQAAFFEQYGAPGWDALRRVVACAHEHDLPVILDAKRGDIGSTSAAYAAAVFGGAPALAGAPLPGLAADAVTVNPYLGDDALAPFLERCDQGKGVFVLARTSNPGAATLQERDCDGRPLYLHVADMIARLGAAPCGRARVQRRGGGGRRHRPHVACRRARRPAARLSARARASAPRAPAPRRSRAFRRARRRGYVVNASRSIIYAWRERGGDYRSAAAAAAAEMRDAIGGF